MNTISIKRICINTAIVILIAFSLIATLKVSGVYGDAGDFDSNIPDEEIYAGDTIDLVATPAGETHSFLFVPNTSGPFLYKCDTEQSGSTFISGRVREVDPDTGKINYIYEPDFDTGNNTLMFTIRFEAVKGRTYYLDSVPQSYPSMDVPYYISLEADKYKSFAYYPKYPFELKYNEDGQDNGYFWYYTDEIPYNDTQGEVVFTRTDGTKEVYKYIDENDDGEGQFVYNNKVFDFYENVYYRDDQSRDNPWGLGKHELVIIVDGKSCTIPVYVVEEYSDPQDDDSQSEDPQPVTPVQPRVETQIYAILDANGGKVDKTKIPIYNGKKYGTLPTPEYSGHYFKGWYTTDGTKITPSTIVKVTKNQKLIAKWGTRKSIAKAKITVASATYNTKKLEPTVTVKLKGKTLKKGTDYKVTYSNNVNAGKKAVAKVTGIGKYKGTVTKKFTIKKCGMGKEYISAKVAKESYSYTGKPIEPSITVYYKGSTVLKKGKDYTVSYLDNTKIGRAQVMITGKGNFKSNSRLFGFEITKAKQPIKLSLGSICLRYRDIGSSTTVTVSGIKEKASVKASSSNKKVATVKKSGSKYKIKYVGVGTAKITFETTKATKHYKKTKKTIEITIKDDRKKPKITIPKNSYAVDIKAGSIDLKATTDSDGALTYKSSDETIATVNNKGKVTICGKAGTAKITITTKETEKYKSVSKTVTINVTDKTRAEQLVEFATSKDLRGKKYVWNTHGPDTFDCSGFVYYVFKETFNIELSTGSSDYWNTPEKYGTVVDEADALPGDVVSWAGHVGIYIGNGEMVNALNSSTGVTITKISEYCNSSGTKNPPHKYIRIKGL